MSPAPQAAADAAKGPSAVYQSVNAPCAQWPERFPPLQRGVLAAARAHRSAAGGAAELVRLRTDRGKPMTGDLPLAAATVKGRTWAAMTGELLAAAEVRRVRLAIGRAPGFFGPGVAPGSVASPAVR
jgi:hypothetical protein